LTDRLRTELVRVSDYKIVERSKIDDILKEQKFQISGCVDECLIELGKMLGANNVVTGSFGKVGNVYTISARMVDAESGEILQAISYDSDYEIGNLLKYGMKECAFRLMDKKPPRMINFNFKKQLLRAVLGYSSYLIVLGLLPPS
jgi:curli biogenesis system outer membrane secretion channel CsgG